RQTAERHGKLTGYVSFHGEYRPAPARAGPRSRVRRWRLRRLLTEEFESRLLGPTILFPIAQAAVNRRVRKSSARAEQFFLARPAFSTAPFTHTSNYGLCGAPFVYRVAGKGERIVWATRP